MLPASVVVDTGLVKEPEVVGSNLTVLLVQDFATVEGFKGFLFFGAFFRSGCICTL